MTIIAPAHITQLITSESQIHYQDLPPRSVLPFVVVERQSPVLLSAPHGARTHRNADGEDWHEEDEYTAGMALLMSDLCGTSVIATNWCTGDSDPNYHAEESSAYKQALRRLVDARGIRWVIDLHGAGETTDKMASDQLVDLGTRNHHRSLPAVQLSELERLLEFRLGKGTVHHNGFAAAISNRSVTAFSHGVLGLHAVQIEMKPSVRVAQRLPQASKYPADGPYSANPDRVIGMMQSLVDFISYLHTLNRA